MPSIARRAAAARALATFAHVAASVPELVDLLGRADEDEGLEILSFASVGRREAAFALGLFAGRAGRRVAAAVAAALGVGGPARSGAVAERATAARRGPRAKPLRLESPFAGLALLLPTMRALAIDTCLSPGQARAVIRSVLDPPPRTENQAEALADLLLPFPIESDLPPWRAVRPEDEAGGSAEEWAAHVLVEFAERLPGLRGSTAPYLRRQFVHVGGTLELEPERLTVRLLRPPLAIVLTIAGLVGELGPLPWRRDHGLRVLLP